MYGREEEPSYPLPKSSSSGKTTFDTHEVMFDIQDGQALKVVGFRDCSSALAGALLKPLLWDRS